MLVMLPLGTVLKLNKNAPLLFFYMSLPNLGLLLLLFLFCFGGRGGGGRKTLIYLTVKTGFLSPELGTASVLWCQEDWTLPFRFFIFHKLHPLCVCVSLHAMFLYAP